MTVEDANKQYFSTNLDINLKPIYNAGAGATSIAGAASFNNWWTTPFGQESRVGSVTARFLTMSGSLATWDLDGFYATGVQNEFFTYEMHGFVWVPSTSATWSFNSRGGELFVFVNNIRRDLGTLTGVHDFGTAATLATSSLGLVQGYYPISVFYAYRNSNFGAPRVLITLSENTPGPVCEGINTRTDFIGAYPFNTTRLIGAASVINPGFSTTTANTLRVVSSSQISASGVGWATNKIRVINGWRTQFTFQYSGSTPAQQEGFAFVIQSAGTDAQGGSSQLLGYDGIIRSLAIEFDTKNEAATDDPFTSGNMVVEAHSNYASANSAGTGARLARSFPAAVPTFAITSDTDYMVIIEMQITSSGTTNNLHVYLDTLANLQGALSTRAPTYTFLVDKTGYGSMFSNLANTAYMGFTGANADTGAGNIDIRDWRIWTTPVAAVRSTLTPASGWNTDIARNAAPATKFTVTLFDTCGTQIPYGIDNVVATLRSDTFSGNPVVGNTKVTYNSLDGTYDVTWWHRFAEVTRLSIVVNNQNIKHPPPQFDLVTITPAPISATSCTWAYNGAPATRFNACSVTAPCNVSAGEVVDFTITARDQFGNPNSALTNQFQMRFSGDLDFTAMAPTPPTYRFTGFATRAVLNTALLMLYSGVDIGTTVNPAITPSQTTGSGPTPTPIPAINVLPATPPNLPNTAASLSGVGYTPGVKAGVVGTMTLKPYDQYGNLIAGVPFGTLLQPTITISCDLATITNDTQARCAAAAWTYPTIVVDPVNAQWILSYNTDLAHVYILDIQYGGVSLPGLARVSVVTDDPLGSTTLIYAQPPYYSSQTGSGTFQARDQYGNYIRNQFSRALTGTYYTVGIRRQGDPTFTTYECDSNTGAQTGTGISVNRCSYVATGLWSFGFTPSQATTYEIRVSYVAVATTSNTTTVLVQAGPPFPPNCHASPYNTPLIAGQTYSINVETRDADNNLRTGVDDSAAVDLRYVGVGFLPAGLAIGDPTPVVGTANYTMTYKTETAGQYELTAVVLEQPIAEFRPFPAPWVITVLPWYGNATMSTVTGPGISGAAGDAQTWFIWQSIDNFGNLLIDSADTFTISVPRNPAGATSFTPLGGGRYNITYTAPSHATPFVFDVIVTLTSQTIVTNKTIANIPTNNIDSNHGIIYFGTLTPTSITQGSVPAVAGNNGVTNIFGRCLVTSTAPITACSGGPRVLPALTAGVPSQFNISDRETDFTGIARVPDVNYVVNFVLRSDPTVTFQGISTENLCTGSVIADCYRITFTGRKAGLYDVSVLANGVIPTNETTYGVEVTVNPGPLHPPTSDVIGFTPQPTVNAGDMVTYTLVYKDREANVITSAAVPQPTTYRLTFQLRNLVGTDFTGNTIIVSPAAPANALLDTNNDGNATITFRPTIAGTMRVSTFENFGGLEFGPAGSRFLLTVNPGPIAIGCIGVAPPAPCPMSLTNIETAGTEFTLTVYLTDQYNNPITNAGQQFNVTAELNGLLPVSGVTYGPQPGQFNIRVTATKRVVWQNDPAPLNLGNNFTVIALQDAISNPTGPLNVASTRIRVNPSDVSATLSWVENVPIDVEAGTPVLPILYLRDRFDNPWFDDYTRVAVRITGPGGISRDLSVSVSGSDGVQQLNPYANYSIKYTPTRATPARPTDPFVPYNMTFKIDNVNFDPVGNKTWTVTAGPAVSLKTIYARTLRPQDNWLAGDVNNITLQLVDQYGNYLLRGGDTVGVTFLNGAPLCSNGTTGNILLNDTADAYFAQRISDVGDGTYVIDVNTTRAQRYTVSITVNEGGVPMATRPCPPLDTQFTIYPLDISPPNCILSGPAVLDPLNNIAGDLITFDVVLRDKYDNNVCLFCEKPPCSCLTSIRRGPAIGPWFGGASVYPTFPVGSDQLCGNPPDPSNWIDLTGAEIGPTLKVESYQNISTSTQDQFGSYRVTFQAQTARVWRLVVTLDITGQYEPIGDQCVDIEISPSYVYQFNVSQSGTLWAGIPDSVDIIAWDRFNNTVRNGQHYWESYTQYQGTNLLRYALHIRSAYSPVRMNHVLTQVFHHGGTYSALLSLRNNRGPATEQPAPKSFNITVLEATCAGETSAATPYRCAPRGNCTADVQTCAGYSPCDTYCAGGAATFADRTTGCGGTCATAGTRCLAGATGICTLDGSRSTSWCTNSACPAASATLDDRNPVWSSNVCNGLQRAAASGCPTDRQCNLGLVQCPDGLSCVRDPANCFNLPNVCSGVRPLRCEDGRCVENKFDCPTPVTCPSGSYICPDGSCQNSPGACPSIYDCYPPAGYRCPDGTCRAAAVDCPSRVVCPPGWLLCPSGHCVTSVSQCSNDTCPLNNVRCPDGACKPTFDLCATGVTCTPNMPVLCHDRTCVRTVSLCKMPMPCPAGFVQCPRGTCAPTSVQCPTDLSCPAVTPVMCPDGLCTNSSANCLPNLECPRHRPFRCPDSSCANNFIDCPTAISCPVNAPVRCSSGGCVASNQMCPDQMQAVCPTGWFRCPGGSCAWGPGECPTFIACQGEQIRCGDGSCRDSCVGVLRDPVRACADGLVECPDYETGYSCAPNYQSCPRAPTCPPERPVRCADRTCRVQIAHCPPEAQYNPTVIASSHTCGGNTWSVQQCGQVSVCPMTLPVMCWDQSCRLTAKDCPPEPICTLESNNPSSVRPFLCSSGSCASRLYNCLADAPCSNPSQIRCAGRFENTPSCVTSVTDCVDVTNVTNQVVVCPYDRSRCRDGSCKDTCPTLVACPHFIPYMCDDGQCVRIASECKLANGCPRDAPFNCSDGSCASSSGSCPSTPSCGQTLCSDGSCRASCPNNLLNNGCNNRTRCADMTCGDCTAGSKPSGAEILSNSCPGQRPYKCPNGACAISSAYCTAYPQTGSCAAGKPFKCANGACVLTPASCPVIQPCPCPSVSGVRVCWTRCQDGRCVSSVDQCPVALKACSGDYPFMCQNGLCAADNNTCIDDRSGCPRGMYKCADGLCMSSSTACAAPTPSNGCPNIVDGYKCWNGACAAGPDACPIPAGCNPGDPASPNCGLRTKTCTSGQVRCADGTCAAPNSCLTAQGCPLDQPFMCADGNCKRYPADGNNGTFSCAPRVVCNALHPYRCADGSCVADSRLCPAYLPCPVGTTRCRDMTCRASCPAGGCPPGSPTLCPSGACVRSYRECGPVPGEACDSSAPFKCFDGSCKRSPLDCVFLQITARTDGATTPSTGGLGHDSVACDLAAGEALCWNGACVPAASINQYCPPIPSCPIDKPFRCQDGSCVNRTASETCPTVLACTKTSYPSGNINPVRCADGTCRATCPQYKGCPLSLPLMCPQRAAYCYAAPSNGANDDSFCYTPPQEVCLSPCNRDTHATPQVVHVPALHDITIDISVDERSVPQEWMEIPASALGGATTFRITPITGDMMKNGYTRINKRAVRQTFQQVAVGVPFTCTTDPVPGVVSPVGSPGKWPLNVTVWGNVDRQKFSTGGAVRPAVTVPCSWIGKYGLTSTVNIACAGNVTFTETTMSMTYNPTANSACEVGATQINAVIASVVNNGDYFEFVWNVTSSTSGASGQICMTFSNVETLRRIYFTDTLGTVCPPNEASGPPYVALRATAADATDACASASAANVIDPVDICFGYFDTRTREFRCIGGYYERTEPDYRTDLQTPTTTGFRAWYEGSGRRSTLMRGRLSSCLPYQYYGFYYVPLPPPPTLPINNKSFWEKYGGIILGVGIGGIIFFALVIYALSRLVRYRNKYREEKKEAAALREQASDMAENFGGLGVYDDEVTMVTNPLVVQFNEQKKKLDELDHTLAAREEQDAAEMDRLDKERQAILKEMERIKAAIQTQNSQKTAQRVDDAPPVAAASTGGGGYASGDYGGGESGGSDQHSFAPQAMGAKPKKRDL